MEEDLVQDLIAMTDMGMIFEVTDDLGIDREAIRVELTKEDPGSIQLGVGDTVEIVVPLTKPLEEWLPILKSELQTLGFG